MVHERGIPHTVFPQSGQHAPDNQSRQGNPVQDRSHNQVARIMGPSQGNFNANIVPLGRSGVVSKEFARADLKNQRQNQFVDGKLGRKQPNFMDGRLPREQSKFTDGRLGQSVNKPGPQGFDKKISLGGIRTPIPTVPMPVPNGELLGGRRQIPYDQMYGTTNAKQNELKDKYDRANLRTKKKGLKTISKGSSILDAYKNLGRR